ncbi:MAG: glycosyl hydrolase [Bacteroidota bacterium]
MNLKLTFMLILALTFSLFESAAQSQSITEQIRKEFADPPMDAWPKVYWWWLNGNIDTVRLVEEIDAMYEAGISGFDIFEIGAGKSDTKMPIGDVVFMEEYFLRAVKIAIDHASGYGMKVGINMASSWNAGGKWITPEYSAKSMYTSKLKWEGKAVKLPFPRIVKTSAEGKIKLAEDDQIPDVEYDKNGKPVYYQEIAVLAIPSDQKPLTPKKIIDVTAYFDPKTEVLSWDQKGQFEIVRFICSNSGEQLKLPSQNSKGPIIDHFDSRATTFHFNYVIDRLKSVLGEDLSSTALNSLYLASYEVVGNVWTETLPETFKSLNGYDIIPYLPVLIDKEAFPEDITNQFKRDFQYTLSELMINNFYRKAKEIANANGLMINSESGGPGFPLHNVPVEPLKSLGVMDLPRGEFWIDHNRLNAEGIDILRVVKEVSSASHIYGRGVVEEESFTSFRHWQEAPADMKAMGDRAFCEGMNRVVVHGWSHNPSWIGKPGIVYGAGTHYNDKRVWWPMVKPFNQYLARLSNVFQKTDFVADVLYYYGDAVPNFAGHKNSRFMVGPGYDYEVINNEILLQLQVKEGNLVLPTGAEFKLLAMEPEHKINPEILFKLKDLVSQGATIVAEKPEGVFPIRNDLEIKDPEKLIDQLWVTADPIKPPKPKKILAGTTSLRVLEEKGILPDFTYPGADLFLYDYIHYQKENSDYYFIRNTTDKWITRECSFRQLDKMAEIWDPISGEIIASEFLDQSETHSTIPVTLAPYGSMLLVFSTSDIQKKFTKIRQPNGANPGLSYHTKGTIILDNGSYLTEPTPTLKENFIKELPISGAWEVFFSDDQNKENRCIFPELTDWTDHEDQSIKYYSGIAQYVKTFQYDINSILPEGKRIMLKLGDLSKIARVTLNGKSVGVCWTEPYMFDVTEIIQPGDNLLEIEVANTWSNRLVGDASKGGGDTFTNITSTNIDGLNKQRIPWKDVPLIKSGLFGPVKLSIYQLLD